MADQQGSGGPGKVYVMKDGDQFKVGASTDPGRRLHEVRANHPGAEIIHRVVTSDKGSGERAAQGAVQHQLGMKKVDGAQSDWYTNPQGARTHKVTGVVDKAVNRDNQN